MIAVLAFAALGGSLFLNTLYLQNVRGFSPLKAGLITVPLALMTLVFAPCRAGSSAIAALASH